MSEGLAVLLGRLQPGEVVAAPVVVEAVRDVEAELAAAFAAGLAAGREDVLPEVDALRAAAAALRAACVVDVAGVTPVVAGLVRAVAERVLLAELKAGGDVLAPLVAAALGEVVPRAAAVVRAHPDALALVEGHLGGLESVADAGLGVGEFVVEGAEFVVPVGLMARLDAVMEGLS